MPTPVIFLHGASSSGKSTLARAVQAQASFPFWHLSIDRFRNSSAGIVHPAAPRRIILIFTMA